MAILSKIRDKSLLLIIFVGVAMFLFVASPDDLINSFRSKSANSVGDVNGEDVTREEFTEKVKNYKANRGDQVNDIQASRDVWESIVAEKIFDSQIAKAGISAGENDVWKALLSDQSISSNPEFLNEAGLFDEEKLKNFIADLKEDDTEQGKTRWKAWVDYENQVKKNTERNIYFNAISAGVGVPMEEAKRDYIEKNTLVSGKYVFLPFASIVDSTITVSDKDIQSYIDQHKSQFKTNATRGIQYVVYQVEPSLEDKQAIEKSINGLLDNFVEYNKITKTNDTIPGFRTTTNVEEFIANHSDQAYNSNFIFKGEQSKIADSLFTFPIGSVYGPYIDNGFYKISKVVEQKAFPKAKASHILISFKESGNPNAKLATKAEAQKKAEEILARIKGGSDFALEAMQNSEDPGSAMRGGDLDWFKENAMVKPFNDWVFSNGVGSIGIVESQFGIHIIKKTDAKTENGYKVATVAKTIEPSEQTVSKAFVEAESLNADVSKNPKDFEKIATAKKMQVQKADRLSRMDENVGTLGANNGGIVYWAFDDKTKVGDVRRFDLEKSYVIAQLTDVQPQGTLSVKGATDRVKPILINLKKAEMLAKKLETGTLENIAQKEKVSVMEVTDANFSNPTPSLSGDKTVLGALLGLKEGSLARNVVGRSGVYAVQSIKRTAPVALTTYQPNRVQLQKGLRKDAGTIYAAVKDAANVGELKL